MIDGVIIEKLTQIKDARGKVMHMLRTDSPLFSKFGEIYFSVVNPDAVKAWKMHHEMTQNLAVPIGKIRLAIYDPREGSKTFGKVNIIECGEDEYCLVRIPPRVWYGFKGIANSVSLIANCADMVHDPSEVSRLEPDTMDIHYAWK